MFSDDVHALYQEMIIEHGRSPRCFGELNPATKTMDGVNPVCGDRVKIYVDTTTNQLKAKFTGKGCAISIAATSLLLETINELDIVQALVVVDNFRAMVKGEPFDESVLGKLVVLFGVKAYPSRIKCATLGCHALKLALADDIVAELATTEG